MKKVKNVKEEEEEGRAKERKKKMTLNEENWYRLAVDEVKRALSARISAYIRP